MRPDICDLINDVADAFGLAHLTPEEFVGRDRHKSLAVARQVAIWVARRRLGLSFPELGREFSRDHTTCMAACHKLDREVLNRPDGALAVQALRLSEAWRPTDPLSVSRTGAREFNWGAVGGPEIELAEGPLLAKCAEADGLRARLAELEGQIETLRMAAAGAAE